MAAGSKNSAQSCHRLDHVTAGFCLAGGVSSRAAVEIRERRFDGKPRMARTISSLPLRSAIRMVAELMLLVDCSSFLRRGGGTSATDRYTSVLSPTEIKIVELFSVTRDILLLSVF